MGDHHGDIFSFGVRGHTPLLFLASSCLALLLLLIGCAVDSRPAEALAKGRDPSFWCVPKLPAGKGRIWIYRTAPKSLGIPPTIVVDGRLYEGLLHGTAYTADVPSGRHQVTLAYDQDKLEVEVTSGEDTFVRFDLDPALLGRGFYPVFVDRQTAQAELRQHTGTNFDCVKD